MKTKKIKAITFGALATMATVTIPVVAAVSCGATSDERPVDNYSTPSASWISKNMNLKGIDGNGSINAVEINRLKSFKYKVISISKTDHLSNGQKVVFSFQVISKYGIFSNHSRNIKVEVPIDGLAKGDEEIKNQPQIPAPTTLKIDANKVSFIWNNTLKTNKDYVVHYLVSPIKNGNSIMAKADLKDAINGIYTNIKDSEVPFTTMTQDNIYAIVITAKKGKKFKTPIQPVIYDLSESITSKVLNKFVDETKVSSSLILNSTQGIGEIQLSNLPTNEIDKKEFVKNGKTIDLKDLRVGDDFQIKVTLKDGFATNKGKTFLVNAHVSEYRVIVDENAIKEYLNGYAKNHNGKFDTGTVSKKMITVESQYIDVYVTTPSLRKNLTDILNTTKTLKIEVKNVSGPLSDWELNKHSFSLNVDLDLGKGYEYQSNFLLSI